GMRVLVTGGAGFIASHICERLVERGDEVVALDNFCTGNADNVAHLLGHGRFRLVEHDVSEPFQLSGPFEAVMHLASPASPKDYFALPIETLKVGSLATFHALDFAREKGSRFFFASTSEV